MVAASSPASRRTTTCSPSGPATLVSSKWPSTTQAKFNQTSGHWSAKENRD